MRYTVRPISDRTWLRPTNQRQQSRFDTTWTKTLNLLAREIDLLGGRDVVLEVDVPEGAIRLDGMLRADARPNLPAVVIAFESKHGPMLYRCDRFVTGWRGDRGDAWQHNVRAIALTLEALRAVDRYGATETGQQYTGFKALPSDISLQGPATPFTSHMTADDAWAILGSFGDAPIVEQRAAAGPNQLRVLHRKARAFAHPDRHFGDRSLWDQVEQAARVLGVAS